MSFGQRMTLARKNKKLTQEDLGNAIGVIRNMIGKYERDEINPSIEVAAKIADALDCSLDYLVRNITTPDTISPQLLEKVNIIQNLEPKDKEHVIAVIEAFGAKTSLNS